MGNKYIGYKLKVFQSFLKEQRDTNKSVGYFVRIFRVQVVRITVYYHILE